MAVRFYNPGFKFREMMKFDHPTNDIKQENINSYWYINAESQSFFEVETELSIETINGPIDIAVPFPKLVKEQLRFSRAVVMIDPKRDVKRFPIEPEDNVALTEKDAKTKAEIFWKDARLKLVREHEDRVRETRDSGRRPQRATGNVKYALDSLGVEDPANDIEDVLTRKQDGGKVTQLEAQLAAMQAQMAQLLTNLTAKGK